MLMVPQVELRYYLHMRSTARERGPRRQMGLCPRGSRPRREFVDPVMKHRVYQADPHTGMAIVLSILVVMHRRAQVSQRIMLVDYFSEQTAYVQLPSASADKF